MKILHRFELTLVFVAVLVLFMVLATPALAFPDVSVSHPYNSAIDEMAASGVISGFTDGTFGADKLVIRQQFAKMIVRTLGLPVAEADFPSPSVPFVDLGPDNPSDRYPHEYVAVCALNGITQGKTPTTFDPYSNIRRTQVISMIVRAAENLAPGALSPVSAGWNGALSYGDPTHGANIQKAEFNGLLAGIQGSGGTLASWDTLGYATRGEVAQMLWRLWQKMGSPAIGREVKIGFVTPLTGGLSSLGAVDQYCLERWQEATAEGVVLGDGRKHDITFILRDSQSNPNRAAQMAKELIENNKVDMMMVGSSPSNVVPVADQCEALGVPSISTGAAWQAFLFGRGGTTTTGFKWTYHFYWGTEDLPVAMGSLWGQVPTNKTVGVLWSNSPDGNAFRSTFTPYLAANSYALVDPGAYTLGTDDYTAMILSLKAAGVDIVTGQLYPPDFVRFWQQSKQQDLKPKIVTVASSAFFGPQAVQALGDDVLGITMDLSWAPGFPFASSLTGETSRELAEDFEASTGEQWEQWLMQYALGEIAVDTLKRATDVNDKQSILDALKTTRLDTIAGPVDFAAPVSEGTLRPAPNVYKSPLAGGQWVKGTKWPYDLSIVGNAAAPGVPVQSAMQLMP